MYLYNTIICYGSAEIMMLQFIAISMSLEEVKINANEKNSMKLRSNKGHDN